MTGRTDQVGRRGGAAPDLLSAERRCLAVRTQSDQSRLEHGETAPVRDARRGCLPTLVDRANRAGEASESSRANRTGAAVHRDRAHRSPGGQLSPPASATGAAEMSSRAYFLNAWLTTSAGMSPRRASERSAATVIDSASMW